MPYTKRKNPKGGVDVLKHGKKVAHCKNEKDANTYIWKASKGDKK